MSFVQLQDELRKLSPQEQLVLADYLVMHAEQAAEPTATQVTELNRRYAEALAQPDKLLAPDDVLRRLRR